MKRLTKQEALKLIPTKKEIQAWNRYQFLLKIKKKKLIKQLKIK